MAGFISEWWPASNRNAGRLQFGIGGRIASEFAAYIASLRARAIQPVIPPKANCKNKRDCDFALYRERNLVERFFQFIKQFRGIATRYEKTARNFSAGLQLVCALAWLK